MRKEIFIVSNNEMVWNEFPSMKIQGDLDDVFRAVRDLVHQGHVVLTHPLSGSVKPHETEFKSIVLEKRAGPMDYSSLSMIESAIATSKKFKKPERDWGKDKERVTMDFMTIDASLLKTGLEGLGRTLYKLISF